MNKQFKIMEMTMEQREKKSAYGKYYYKEHKEEMNAYSREYYKEHKEWFSNYNKIYTANHSEEKAETARRWRIENTKFIVYFHMNIKGECLYIGSSARPIIERQSAHLTNNSNLKMNSREYKEKYEIAEIKYLDFTEFGINRQDLFYLESYLKSITKEVLGKMSVAYREEELSMSKKILQELVNKVEFKIFDKLDKYLE